MTPLVTAHAVHVCLYCLTGPPVAASALVWHWRGYSKGGRYDRWKEREQRR